MQGWTTSIQNLIKFSEIPTVVVLGPLIFEIHPHLHGWDCKVDSFLGFRSAKLWEVLPDARGLWDVQAYGLKWIDAGCPKKWGMCCSFFWIPFSEWRFLHSIPFASAQHTRTLNSMIWSTVRMVFVAKRIAVSKIAGSILGVVRGGGEWPPWMIWDWLRCWWFTDSLAPFCISSSFVGQVC